MHPCDLLLRWLLRLLQALQSLLLHVDVDDAYRTALGLYELPLAYMVVHASSQVGACMQRLVR